MIININKHNRRRSAYNEKCDNSNAHKIVENNYHIRCSYKKRVNI